MTTEPQWQIVIQHTQEAWVDAWAAMFRELGIDDPDKAQRLMARDFTVPRQRDGRDEFEPTPEGWSDWQGEGADRAEARETDWRLGR